MKIMIKFWVLEKTASDHVGLGYNNKSSSSKTVFVKAYDIKPYEDG